MSPPGPVIEGSTVTLVCEATAGDLPISYSWIGPNGPLEDTANISVTLQASVDYGTYMCTATNEFGSGTANVEMVRAGRYKRMPVFPSCISIDGAGGGSTD